MIIKSPLVLVKRSIRVVLTQNRKLFPQITGKITHSIKSIIKQAKNKLLFKRRNQLLKRFRGKIRIKKLINYRSQSSRLLHRSAAIIKNSPTPRLQII